MFSKSFVAFVALSLLSVSEARLQWLERDGKPVVLGHINRRSFGHENPAVIQKLSAACPGQICGTLAGAAITPLLAAQPECSQQDMADQIIDAAQQFDDATKKTMIAIAVEYRQSEKNTPPDFSTNPPTQRNSVFCQKAPKNPELNGLVQAQDPANDPNVFFDPATKGSVKKGSQANTAPFGGAGAAAPAAPPANTAAASEAAPAATDVATGCAPDVTVTVTAGAEATAAPAPAPAPAGGAASGAIGNFGSCSVPQIEFGQGFDNRKETSFQPKDKASFDHGSAQAIGIIATSICDTLVNKCKADDAAKATCKEAQAAAQTGAAKTGAQADLFNAKFGITTNFAAVQAIDDQGRAVGAPAGNAAVATPPKSNNAAAAAGGIGNFGKCSVPEIEFGKGFDNRKETSFQPKDKASFNHGSAQAIGIIATSICDTLTNSCGADAAAKATCAKAQAAAQTGAAKTGEQADLFNAAFGKQTNFKNVQAFDDQGRAVGAAAAGGAAAPAPAPQGQTGAANGGAAAPAPAQGQTGAAAGGAAAAGGIGNFGSCSVPQIEFGKGFDNRKETAFQPTDKASFNHESAQNGAIITQFVCDTLVNKCGADAAAKATCAKARAAFDAATPVKTGAQADAFNAVFGKQTNFKAVAVVDNTGKVVSA